MRTTLALENASRRLADDEAYMKLTLARVPVVMTNPDYNQQALDARPSLRL
jgi:hypothetical protein